MSDALPPAHPPLIRSPALARVAGVAHGFTTRAGGVSEGALATLNLAARPAERAERLVENWARALAAVDPSLAPGDLALIGQVHGDRVVEIHEPGGPLLALAEADAAFTTAAGVALAVRVADCVPVLVASGLAAGPAAGPAVIGVAHAGWRGTAARVVPALIGAMTTAGVAPGDLVAAIGPCISVEAYEVGDEVVEGLRAAGLPDEAFLVRGAERGWRRPHVDLRRAVRWQLVGCGVGAVDASDRCTARDPDLFSHRRDGEAAGRLAGVIARVRR